MKNQAIELELTEDYMHFKKGDVITRSRDIAEIHLSQLKNAKLYVKTKKKKTDK